MPGWSREGRRGRSSSPRDMTRSLSSIHCERGERDWCLCPLEAGHKPLEIPKPPGHIVHLKMTSATTGAPRLVAFTAPQLMADAENIMATMGLRADWPNLGVISLAHSYGFSNLVLPLLLHGIPLILLDSALPEILRRTADAELGITLAAVPALWRAWHDAQAISANVRLAISAGAPLPLPLERSVFSRFNLKIHNFLWQQRMRRNCLRPHRRAAERNRLRRFGDERGRVSVG